MTHPRPVVGAPVELTWFQRVSGGDITIGGVKSRWTMLFVYRGKHCPRCKRFLKKLNDNLDAWTAVMDVVVVSADSLDKALADRDAFGWKFDLCYGMRVGQMRALGLYVSEPLSPDEADGLFAEPGAFAIRPDGSLMLADISNGPGARPDLEELLDGMTFNITNDRPTRGLA